MKHSLNCSFLLLVAVAAVLTVAPVNAQTVNSSLQIKRGQDDTVYRAKHRILGLADPAAGVSVNGTPVKVHKTGTWGIELKLSEGNNTVKVVSGSDHVEFDLFYSTRTPVKPVDPDKEQAALEAATFYPSFLRVKTLKYAYLNYGAGTDRLGGAKINYLPEGVELFVDAENANLYRVRLSQNRHAYIPKSLVEPVGRYLPEAEFMLQQVVLSSSASVYNAGGCDRVSIAVGGKKPYVVKEYVDPHKIVVDLYGVQCNSNWLTHKTGLKSVDHIDVESIDTDVTRFTVYLKTRSSWGFSMDYRGDNLVLDIRHVPASLQLKDLTIGIDAGHGGPNSNGAVGLSGLLEKDMNLAMAYELKKILEKEGANVVLTREGDEGMSIRERQDKMIQARADLVISIHCNAGGNPLTTGGTSTYYRYDPYHPLAAAILDELLTIKGVQNFGLVGNFNFSLSAITDFPCVLVETLFISNLWDEEQLADAQFRKKMMEEVADGLEVYLKRCRSQK